MGVIVRVCFDLGFVISVKFGWVMGGRVIRVSRVIRVIRVSRVIRVIRVLG